MAKKTSKPTSAPSHPPTKPTTAEDIDDIFATPLASTSTSKPSSSKLIASGSAPVTGELAGKKKKNKGEKRKVEVEGGVGVDGPGGVDELNNEGISGGPSKKKKMKKKNIDGTLSSGLETQPKRSTKPLPKPTSKPKPNPDPETSPEIITISDPSILLKPSQSNLSLIPTTSESTNGKRKGKRTGGGGGGGKVDDDDEEMFRDSRGDGPRRKTEEGFIIFKEAELDIDPEAGGTDLCPFDCDCCF